MPQYTLAICGIDHASLCNVYCVGCKAFTADVYLSSSNVLQRQDMSCIYLAHHELESVCSIIINTIIIIVLVITIAIIIVIIGIVKIVSFILLVAVVVIIVNVMQAYAHILGLHSHVLRAIPIFVVYLATLMHVYALARQQVRPFASCPALHDELATSFCVNKITQV